jgi:hypothetical protein
MGERTEIVGVCEPDYEREFYRLIKENAQLKEENDELRKTIIEMCKNLFVKGGEGRWLNLR